MHLDLVQTQTQIEAFIKQSIDTPDMTSGLSLYLATKKAEHLRNGCLDVNCHLEELEAHQDEVRQKGLLKTDFGLVDIHSS